MAFALLGALACAALGDLRAQAAPGVLILLVWGAAVATLAPEDGRTRWILAVAVAVRLPLLTLSPTLSDDLWRYLWEGAVWRAGFNPFTYAPDAPELEHLRNETWAQVNHRSIPSIYPPLAQAAFVALAGWGPLGWRVASSIGDIVTAGLLARRRPRAGWWWALLPLPAVESAVSGHLEGIGVALLVASLTTGKPLFTWAGAMVKLLPGVLLALQPRRTWPAWAALTLAVTLPVVRVEGFETYRASWAFNGSIHPLLEAAVGPAARTALQGVGALVVLLTLWRSRDPARVALWTTGTFVILSPTVHPWYVLWPLSVAMFARVDAWIVLGVTVPGAYIVLGTYDAATSRWEEWVGTRWLVYLPFYLAIIASAWRRATRAGPAAVH